MKWSTDHFNFSVIVQFDFVICFEVASSGGTTAQELDSENSKYEFENFEI